MVIDNDLRCLANACKSKEEMYHHGIGGQKWGEQNGPPYPLNPNKDYSKAEKKAMKKEYRKEVRRQKKERKRNEKEEERKKRLAEEEARLEEEKNKAIKSGSIKDVDKYKDRMTNEELKEAMERIKNIQSFEDLKIKDLTIENDRIQKELDKITKENNLREQELKKKYGPKKAEELLKKTGRITKSLGDIAMDLNKGTVLYKSIRKIINEELNNNNNNPPATT